jgi:hypothetical protein
VGGLAAGLLVNSIQSGLLTAPAPKPPGATPQSTGVTKPPGSALPSGAVPVQGVTVVQLPGYTSVIGQVPQGSSIPTPNRPPTAAEQAAYDQAAAQEAAMQQEAEQRWAQQNPTPGGAIPTVPGDSGEGGIFDWLTGQSGAAVRVTGAGAARRAGFGGMAASFRK